MSVGLSSLSKYQADIYNKIELPRLQHLLRSRLDAYGMSQRDLSNQMSNVLESFGWPTFSEKNISAIIREQPINDTREAGWHEQRLWKLAVGLQIDPNPVISLIILRAYLLGCIDLKPEKIAAFKGLIGVKSSGGFRSTVDEVERSNPGAVRNLLINSKLSKSRLEELCNGERPYEDEITIIVSWAEHHHVFIPRSVLSQSE